MTTNEPQSKEDKEYSYIVNLLLACGQCVKLGYMRPFIILHSNIDIVKANLLGSPNKKAMVLSYNRYLEQSRKINPFHGE